MFQAFFVLRNGKQRVLPDIPLNNEKLKPFEKEKDPFLAFAKNYAEKEKK